MTSDSILEQLHARGRGMLGRRRFAGLLPAGLENGDLSQDLAELRRAFDHWRGDEPLHNDITVLS